MKLRASTIVLAGSLGASCSQDVQGLDETALALINLSGQGVATQSSTLSDYGPELATDGDLTTFNHTAGGQFPARWQIVLPRTEVIRRVIIHNRRGCCGDRTRDLNLIVLDAPRGNQTFNYAALTGRRLNPGNVLGTPLGLEVDVWKIAGHIVRGAVVLIERQPDTAGGVYTSVSQQANLHSLNLAEVDIWVPRL